MPTYTFENIKTGKQFTEIMTIAEMEDYLKRRKSIRQVIQPLNIIRGTGTPKTDSGWKDNLSRIAEAHPSSPLAQRYGAKSTKEIKTKEVIKKHRRRRRGLK